METCATLQSLHYSQPQIRKEIRINDNHGTLRSFTTSLPLPLPNLAFHLSAPPTRKMSLTLPASLANLTISHLNFTLNCSNVVLGLTVWENDFNSYNATPGNQTATNDLPGGSDNPIVVRDLESDDDTFDEDGQSVDPVDNGPADAYPDVGVAYQF